MFPKADVYVERLEEPLDIQHQRWGTLSGGKLKCAAIRLQKSLYSRRGGGGGGREREREVHYQYAFNFKKPVWEVGRGVGTVQG